MTPNNSLNEALFTTRHPLYFSQNSANSESDFKATGTPLASRPYFECGKVQAPRFGDRTVYVEDTNNSTRNDTNCSAVLFSLFNQMRKIAQQDPKKLELFNHPDSNRNLDIEKVITTFTQATTVIGITVTVGATAPVLLPIVISLTGLGAVLKQFTTGTENATYFNLDSTNKFRLRPNPWFPWNSSHIDTDVLCGSTFDILSSKTQFRRNVYVEKDGQSKCPEILEFTQFIQQTHKPITHFPNVEKTYQGWREN